MKNIFSDLFGKGSNSGKYPQDEKGVLEYLLDTELPELMKSGDLNAVRRGDSVYISELQMSVSPSVKLMTGGNSCGAHIGFDMYSDKWEKRFYEMCSGMGKDVKSAVGMSLASFMFAFMEGIERTVSKDSPVETESEFLGKKHRWDVYISDILGTGTRENDIPDRTRLYWELLKDDIIKRLGNQNMVYVKIYAANIANGKNVIGEVRIDDIPIPELGDKVADIARRWRGKDNSLISDKQFFFIEQKETTLIQTQYSGKSGREALKKAVVKYLELFASAETQESYDSLAERAGALIGDKTLAWECFNFLPEICASHAFEDKININGNIVIRRPDGSEIKEYLHRLTDYYPLEEVFMSIMQDGIFGSNSNKIYRELISVSSIYNCIAQAEEKNASKPLSSPLTLMHMVFFADEDTVIR